MSDDSKELLNALMKLVDENLSSVEPVPSVIHQLTRTMSLPPNLVRVTSLGGSVVANPMSDHEHSIHIYKHRMFEEINGVN